MNMKAVTFNPDNDRFKVTRVSVPRISDTDVLVKVAACGLNPVDAKIRFWKVKAPDMDASWVPGLDVSGTVVETGKKVTGVNVGDRILCHGNMFRPHGGFAEFTVQDARAVIPHPETAPTIAAATPCAGWTAWRALVDKLGIQGRDEILIIGGSGGVGGFAIQIARHFDLKKIIVTCSAANHDYVTKLGATHVIDYHTEDVAARVLEITDRQGVSACLDAVGADNDILGAKCLGFEGRMVELVDTVRPLEYPDAFGKGLSFHQLSLGSGHRFGPQAKANMISAGAKLSQLVEKGKIQVPVLKTIALEEVGEALNGILDKRTVGKIVMEI